jgi:hypothetical protein
VKAERDELERLWAESQSEVRAVRKRLEDCEARREIAAKEREDASLPPPLPPSPQPSPGEKGESSLPRPPAPPRVAGATNNALDTLSKKLRLMSDQLNRTEPTS